MKTMIAVPCGDLLPTQFVTSLMDLDKDNETRICFKAGSLVYDARNLLALTAIERKFDRVLWLDSDMVFNTHILEQFHSVMDEGYDMVTGLYFKRMPPYTPVILSELDPPTLDEDGILVPHVQVMKNYPESSRFQVAGCGFGAVMTSTRLLKMVWDKYGPAFIPTNWCGEDYAFCWRARQMGAKIMCDSTISMGHLATVVLSEDTRENFSI